jgi:hypothetical protein
MTDPDDIILGPPKTSFASATSVRNANKAVDSPDRPPLSRDFDSRDRHSFRRGTDADEDRLRDGRSTNLRAKRPEGDQDSDGWSTVKPRKSFGTEGAERFNGRMGGDRHREERGFRHRDDRDMKERPARGFDTFSREKDGDVEREGTRRNGTGRGRDEPSWFKDSNEAPPLPLDRRSNGERYVDRSRGWREKEREDKTKDRGGERGDDRTDRRWDRDRHQEHEPEWMDEPAQEKKQAHTQEDFQKWKERMKAGTGSTPAEERQPKAESNENGGQASFFGLDKTKSEPLVVLDSGPDKFFGLWATPSPDTPNEPAVGSKKEGMTKPKTTGKSSRFTSFFAPQEDPQRRQSGAPPPVPSLPPQEANPQASKEKEDFQRLLQKLQSQSFGTSSSTAPTPATSQKKHQSMEKQQIVSPAPQDTFQQYRLERQEPPRTGNRDSQQALQDLLGQRQAAVSQPSARPEQMLQELVNQRQSALSQSSSRSEQVPNRNAEFLVGLMQSARAAPEPLRSEQVMMRMPPPQQQQQQQMTDREQEMQREQRERNAAQRQRRPEAPPGFFDDQLFQRGPQPSNDGNPNPRSQGPPQPTQILQRPPPGLDQLPPGWGAPNAQLPPPMSQQRHIAPPPGLPGGPSRGMPMPQNMFPPGFPPMAGAMPYGPAPDSMPGGPPRNMPPPPPGFMMPPPGFMGGPPMNAFQGPEMAYGPFAGRGGPQGDFRRQ